MIPISPLRSGSYSTDWIKDFYTQAGIWWGEDPHDDPGDHTARAALVERLCGPSKHRVLDLGTGSGFTAAALADAGHDEVDFLANRISVAGPLMKAWAYLAVLAP